MIFIEAGEVVRSQVEIEEVNRTEPQANQQNGKDQNKM